LGAKIENQDFFRHGGAKVQNPGWTGPVTFHPFLRPITGYLPGNSVYSPDIYFTIKRLSPVLTKQLIMKSRIQTILLVFLSGSVLFLGSCKHRRGNGNIVTIERSVDPFDRVEVHGAIDVYVSQGPQQPVKLECDENLVKYIIIEEHGGELEVRTKSGVSLSPSRKMKVYVTAPKYEKLGVSGACNIIGENKISSPDRLEIEVSGAGNIRMDVDAPDLKAGISGAGKVDLTGKTRDFELRLSGAGKALCYNMLAENTKVDISGAGAAEVYASVSLDAEVSGAGNVRYKGGAPEVKQRVSGAGSVKKAD
jgi:hypothetical protein